LRLELGVSLDWPDDVFEFKLKHVAKFIMGNKTTKCMYRYGNLLFYRQCSLLHVAATCCCPLQGGVLWRV